MCAWRSRRGRVRQARQNTEIASVGVSPPIFFSFVLSVLASVMPGLDPGIHAEVTLVQCFHRHLPASRQHGPPGQSPVGTNQRVRVVAFHGSGAKARRENEIARSSIRHPEVAAKGTHRASAMGSRSGHRRATARASWADHPSRLAASRQAPQDNGMTSDLTYSPVPLFPAAGHPSPPRGDYLEG